MVCLLRSDRYYLALRNDFFDASHLSAFQTHLDAVRMLRRFGKDLFDDTLGQLAGALVLFQDDEHGHARFNISAGLAIHRFISWNRSGKP